MASINGQSIGWSCGEYAFDGYAIGFDTTTEIGAVPAGFEYVWEHDGGGGVWYEHDVTDDEEEEEEAKEDESSDDKASEEEGETGDDEED